MHETHYSHGALEHHFRYFGDSVTYRPLGGSGTSIEAQVMDLPDNPEVIGRRFRVRASDVATPRPGDEITDSDGTWVVKFTSRPHGGSLDLDCELHQLEG